ncbi:MAG: peptidylprolyl isomerase [Magnetococcales bacterium]|nr:peptidylprolyl isomerase [Magnetococcales bacterium]MBF0150062.1 peptidylprolyl isomerase [Magnetococcales bacterium]
MDHVLASSHGAPITVNDVVTYLKVTGAFGSAIYRLMEMRTVEQEVRSLNIEISEEMLHAHLSMKRRMAGLAGAIEFNTFCHQNGILYDQWKEIAENDLKRHLLKRKVVSSPEIQAYFERNQEQLKKICVARIVCRSQDEAHRLKNRILSGESDFSTLARQYSLEHNSRVAGGHLGCVGRGVFSPDIERDLFSAETGMICGPYAQNGYWAIYFIEEILNGTLTDTSMHQIADKLFQDWLSARVLRA